MAIDTREIHEVNQQTGERRYAGYAKFDGDKYLGSFGGYNQEGKKPEWGQKSNAGYSNNKSGGSALQNSVKLAGAKQAKRTKAAFKFQLR